MAIGQNTVWECRSTATAANVNGGGFNPGNSNFISDWTATSANTASPVVSSASYSFIAGDVNAYFYVKSGTNWTPGWYKIVSVAGGSATLDASVGAAVNGVSGLWQANTVAGCATVASPSSGVCGIDFSQQDAAVLTNTDLASSNGTTNPSVVSSAGSPLSNRLIGNIIHVTAGTNYLASWYEIVSISGANATLDRAVASAASVSGGTFYVGGAISLGSSTANQTDLNFFNRGVAGNTVWIKQGTYTLGVSITSTVSGTTTLPFAIRGYNTLRADNPTTRATMPKLVGTFYPSVIQFLRHIYFRTNGAGNNGMDGGGIAYQCIWENADTNANNVAVFCSSHTLMIGCEIVCYRGRGAVPNTGSLVLINCYIHHCVDGLSLNMSGASFSAIGCVFEGNTNSGIRFLAALPQAHAIMNCTFYGAASKLGTGILFDSTSACYGIMNNIFYGLATAINASGQRLLSACDNNTFYNNTTDVTNVSKGQRDIALDPGFTNVGEYTGTTATTSGSVLTDSGANFANVVAGQDFLYLVSGTGITAGIYGITGKTSTTITLDSAPGDSATGDKVYKIIYGHNYSPGTNMKAAGYPNNYGPSLSTTYLDIGAIQRKEKVSTDPGAANVASGIGYTIDDVSKTGTLVGGGVAHLGPAF